MNLLRRLKLRHLEVFVEVARLSSVSRTAATLGLTQPAVTRSIRDLEDICGRPLVEKDGRGIKITAFGEEFVRHAGTSLAAARQGLAAMAELRLSDGPQIRIGALPTVSATIVPKAVAAYLQSGVQNRLRIISGQNRVLLRQLREGELDLVVGRLPAPEDMHGLSFEPLYRERVVFAVDANHPLASAVTFSASSLSQYPVLVPNEGSIIRPLVERLFLEQGFPEPVQAIETVSDSFGRTFIKDHQAIWIISHGVIARELTSGQFVELPVDTRTTLGAVGLCTPQDTHLPAGTNRFAQIIKDVARTSPLTTLQ